MTWGSKKEKYYDVSVSSKAIIQANGENITCGLHEICDLLIKLISIL